MSEEDRRVNKRSTGTVPKQRNHSRPFTGVERLRSLSNSSSDCYPSRDSSKEFKIPRRSNQFNQLIVESTLEDQNFSSPQISYVALNSIGSSHPSSPNSRRNSSSSTLKCDNIMKGPNKKQIEDKLNQIHEYLKVTNSLMESMKKTDEQVPGRSDEYSMEGAFSSRKNEENANLDYVGDNLGILKEYQQMAYPLRRKAENKRCQSSQNQSNLLLEVCNDIHSPLKKDSRNFMEFDTVSKDRTEKLKMPLQPPHTPTVYNQDKGFPNLDSLHKQIMSMHNSHDESERLLDTLDSTDSELAKQHAELHKKLIELQSRKYQIDHLVAQLQSFGESYEDTDNQCKNICAMNEQLSKLKDMLEVVKLPDNILQNTNHSCDNRKMSCYLCSDVEQFREKDVKNPKFHSGNHDSNTFVNENITTRDTKPKQLNNSSRDRGNHFNKGNMLSIVQKLALQSELECKKRELVEIMGKHKGNASNLNQDVGIDTKSEISSANGLNEPWTSILTQESDSERFSSDDCQDDVNNYQELKHNFLSLPSLNYSPSSMTNYQSENSHRNCEQSSGCQPLIVPTYEPEIHFRSNSVGATSRLRRSSRRNEEDPISNQVQKQLQMIKSMCDSMLEQQISQENPSNAQQLRNNLIPSPPRRHLPHPQRSNTNAANPSSEVPPQSFTSNTSNSMSNDIGSYYNWLSNNTIQTQSFVLNTLNQCYQMLWLQQRELATVKNNLSILQERFNTCSMGSAEKYSPPSLHTNPQVSPNRRMHQTGVDVHKINQQGSFTVPVPEPFDCSLPNTSLNYLNNNSQLLDSCLNNINANRVNMQHNSTVPSMPTTIGHSLPNHIWSGQALNNQVVPGNRANNYWDNFRSYSRQNLLSSKNNEVLQNLPSSVIDRSNFTNQCADPFTFISLSKSNSEQDSTSTFQENTPQGMGTKETGVLSSEILNINNPMRNTTESPSRDVIHKDDSDVYFGLPIHLNSNNDVSRQHSNMSGSHILADSKERNERIENSSQNSNFTSLFEEMRENIYKEVATLISANENRPEFLIQLFRDLQMVDSDNGRYNILQSIGRNVTLSRVFTPTVDKNDRINRTFTSQDVKTLSSASANTEYVTYSHIFQEVHLFLEHHEDVIIQDEFVTALKRFLFGLESFKSVTNDSRFMEHLNKLFSTELGKYYGKQLSEIKMELLESTNCIMIEHLGITRFDEDFVDTCNIRNSNQEISNSVTTTVGPAEDGDLAEADQSRLINEDIAEEGAVGGILDSTTYITEVSDLSVSVQLPRSQSVTPTKDQPNANPKQ